MKNLLEEYLLCDLYQVKETKGYLLKENLTFIGSGLSYRNKINETCNNIGPIIVKKSIFFPFKYNLHEAITNVPLDTLYTNASFMEGIKKEYHTFVVITQLWNHTVKLADLKKYCDEHKNCEAYRQELLSLLKQGKNNLEKAKQKEIDNNEVINSIVRSLLLKKD